MARRGDLTLENINREALALFAEKGVDRTTINDIATRAGIAEGTIYRHYASKDELIWGLFAANYVSLAERLDALQAAEGGLRAKLAAMVGLFCRLFDSEPAMFSFLLLVQHGQLRRVTPEMTTPVRVLRRVLSEAVRRGEIPAQDPEVATAIVFGIVLQPAVFKVYGTIERPMADLSDHLAAACWRSLGGTDEGGLIR